MSTKILLLCFILGCVSSAMAAGWEGTFTSSRHGGFLYLCEFEGGYRGSFDGIGIITSTTSVSSTSISGNYIEAGSTDNAGTFSLFAVNGNPANGFTGYFQVNGGSSQMSWRGNRVSRFSPGSEACMIPVTADNDLNSHWSYRANPDRIKSTYQNLDLCARGDEESRNDEEEFPDAYGSAQRWPDHFWYMAGEFLDDKRHWVGNVWHGLNLEGNSDNNDRISAGIGMARQLDNATMVLTYWATGQDLESRMAINGATPVTSVVWKRYDGSIDEETGKPETEYADGCSRHKELSEGDFDFPEVLSAASSLSSVYVAVASVFAALFFVLF